MANEESKGRVEPQAERYPWTLETIRLINKLTPQIKGKAFDPDWFLLRQRFEEIERLSSHAPQQASAPTDGDGITVCPLCGESAPAGNKCSRCGEWVTPRCPSCHQTQEEYVNGVGCEDMFHNYGDAPLASAPKDAAHDDDYVAWLTYRRHGEQTTIHVCDSDEPRAFKVYRQTPKDAAPGQMPSCHVCGAVMVGVCRKCETITEVKDAASAPIEVCARCSHIFHGQAICQRLESVDERGLKSICGCQGYAVVGAVQPQGSEHLPGREVLDRIIEQNGFRVDCSGTIAAIRQIALQYATALAQGRDGK